jgi:hypothetical protein
MIPADPKLPAWQPENVPVPRWESTDPEKTEETEKEKDKTPAWPEPPATPDSEKPKTNR